MRTIQYKLDKAYNLRMDMEAIEKYESITNKPWITTDLANLTVKQMLAIIWSASNDDQLTIEDLKKLVNEHSDISQLYEKSLETAMATMPEPKEKQGGSKNVKKV
jgi:hypothetical protein